MHKYRMEKKFFLQIFLFRGTINRIEFTVKQMFQPYV